LAALFYLYPKIVRMSLNLKVEIDIRSGFCFGVVRAITRAEEILEAEGKLFCLGQIVHNDEEVKRLESKGLITIQHSQLPDIHNSKVLIRAHGEPPETYELLRKNGNEILRCHLSAHRASPTRKEFKEIGGGGEYCCDYRDKKRPYRK
jgi:4-hydroxy-3-methylbut-2-enyl diphosphate reductase